MGVVRLLVYVMGLGLKFRETPSHYGDGVILVVGKTIQAAKVKVCSAWVSLFGDAFKYDSGKKRWVLKRWVYIWV